MAGDANAILTEIEILFRDGRLADLGDGTLLERFRLGGEEGRRAFEVLVSRHGPMVLGVARRLLGDPSEAEDVYQATFLVLALRAGAIRRRDSLGPWLHGVAARIARRARESASRRRRHESAQIAPEPSTPSDLPAESSEMRAVLDEELARLPDKYRGPVVLCYLEGLSQEEAAQALGWTKGTVSGRIARAKELLRRRLTRRGLAPAVAILPPSIAEAAKVPPTLVEAIARAAVAVALGRARELTLSRSALAMARDALAVLRLAAWRSAAVATAPAALLGAVAWAFAAARPAVEPAPPVIAAPQPVASPRPADDPPGRPEHPVEPPDEVDRAIAGAVRFLKSLQREDGSWPDADQRASTGTTSLILLALLTAGEAPDSPPIDRGLRYLERFSATDLGRTYSVALQTMVFCKADPERYRDHLTRNVEWLERAQLKDSDHFPWPGSWTYTLDKESPGDNSNTHYAMLGLEAARRVGVEVNRETLTLAADYWENAQNADGSWGYMPRTAIQPTGSMTCAGITGLAIASKAGIGGGDSLDRGLRWLAEHFSVAENPGKGQLWTYYYLESLAHAATLAGRRSIGDHDWYREGCEHLLTINERDPFTGAWTGRDATEREPVIATSYAVLFLAQGRPPADAGR